MHRRFAVTMAVLNLASCGGSALSNVAPEAGTGDAAGITGMGGSRPPEGGAAGQGGNDSTAQGGGAQGGGAGRAGAASGGGAGTAGGPTDAALPSACDAGADPTKTYLGTSPATCAAIRFACPAGSDAFFDACGCGCVRTCASVQCFRAINCVTACGGPVISSGCCPCTPPGFDSITCMIDAGSSQ